MAWGYWSATSIDRGRSPRRNTNTQQCSGVPVGAMPPSEPPPTPQCYSPCRSPTCGNSPCQSPCHSPCRTPCHSPCGSPCQAASPIHQHLQHSQQHQLQQDDFSRRPSLDRLDSPQVIDVAMKTSLLGLT